MRSISQKSESKLRPDIRMIFGLAITFTLPPPPIPMIAQIVAPQTRSTPSQLPATQIAADTKLEFDVASIRPSQPGTSLKPSMILNSEDTPVPPGGLFIADFPLEIYIEFAYKIMPTREQEEAMSAHLPKWARTDHFVVEAKAAGHPTKDQIRLMMRSLLADRFKLVVHSETHEMPVLALVMNKPGSAGPRLRPHTQGAPCDVPLPAPADRTASTIPPGEFIETCGRVQMIKGPNRTMLLGGRNISIDHLAGYLPDFEDMGRPIVDQTGLEGTFDFSLNWSPEPNGPSPADKIEQLDTQGPPFVVAIREQLGLKLKSARAPIQTLVVDHIEPLTPN